MDSNQILFHDNDRQALLVDGPKNAPYKSKMEAFLKMEEGLAVASIARDDPPASSTVSSRNAR